MARPKVYSIDLTDDERSKLNKVIKKNYLQNGPETLSDPAGS